jgi:hypothetical protein
LTFNGIHGVVSKKIGPFITTGVRTSIPTSSHLIFHLVLRLEIPHFVTNKALWFRSTGEIVYTEVSRKWGGGYKRERCMCLAIIRVKVVTGVEAVVAAGTSVSQGLVRGFVYVYLESLEGK